MDATAAPASTRHAYRFRMDAGKVSLETVETVHGQFRQRRGAPDWNPGMFCYRLLDAQDHVLAEETQPAPDHRCVVLDPHVTRADGSPLAAALTADGPTIFQVRMPRHDHATTLRIYRLSGPRPADADAEPAGELLASIPVPPP